MPRAISLPVKSADAVGEALVAINVAVASLLAVVGVDPDPVFVEAGKKEHPLSKSNVQHMINTQVCICCERWRIPCASKDLFLTLARIISLPYNLLQSKFLNPYIAQNWRSSLSLYKYLIRRGKALGDLAVSIGSRSPECCPFSSHLIPVVIS
jgi:hypothetical protein